MSEKSERVKELEDKPTRDAFVSSQMSIPLAFQIQALREQQGLTQKQLAEKAGMLQPRIAAMEHPSGSEPNLRTLKRLASAFDVALIVRCAPFSELVEWADNFSPDTFIVPSFHDDPGFHQREAASSQQPVNIYITAGASATSVLQEKQTRYNLPASPFVINATTRPQTPAFRYDQPLAYPFSGKKRLESSFVTNTLQRFQTYGATAPGVLLEPFRGTAADQLEKKAS